MDGDGNDLPNFLRDDYNPRESTANTLFPSTEEPLPGSSNDALFGGHLPPPNFVPSLQDGPLTAEGIPQANQPALLSDASAGGVWDARGVGPVTPGVGAYGQLYQPHQSFVRQTDLLPQQSLSGSPHFGSPQLASPQVSALQPIDISIPPQLGLQSSFGLGSYGLMTAAQLQQPSQLQQTLPHDRREQQQPIIPSRQSHEAATDRAEEDLWSSAGLFLPGLVPGSPLQQQQASLPTMNTLQQVHAANASPSLELSQSFASEGGQGMASPTDSNMYHMQQQPTRSAQAHNAPASEVPTPANLQSTRLRPRRTREEQTTISGSDSGRPASEVSMEQTVSEGTAPKAGRRARSSRNPKPPPARTPAASGPAQPAAAPKQPPARRGWEAVLRGRPVQKPDSSAAEDADKKSPRDWQLGKRPSPTSTPPPDRKKR